jgi:ATP/maltotriose-dependent transcriptional regulator MalT
MALTLFLNDMPGGDEAETSGSLSHIGEKSVNVRGLPEKLAVPEFGPLIERRRLVDLCRRSADRHAATIICGRSGTGKSALAASFLAGREKVAWYTVDSGDIDFSVFARYFAAALQGVAAHEIASTLNGELQQAEIADFLVNCFASLPRERRLGLTIVLDDFHHVFDAEWFPEFFNLLVFSLPAESHLMLLCRSRPPVPLWRLRSKQVANVIDEQSLAVDRGEAIELCSKFGVSGAQAAAIARSSFGRIEKIVRASQALKLKKGTASRRK